MSQPAHAQSLGYYIVVVFKIGVALLIVGSLFACILSLVFGSIIVPFLRGYAGG